VYNFHYANRAGAYLDNSGLGVILGNNETGFSQADSQYRREAYIALLSGAAYFNNLDYSFTVDDPSGLKLPPGNPAGGGPVLRKQLAILKSFFESFDFIRMSPSLSTITAKSEHAVQLYVMAEVGNQYAVFIRNGSKVFLEINLPGGEFEISWLNTKNGEATSYIIENQAYEDVILESPTYDEDIALSIRRK